MLLIIFNSMSFFFYKNAQRKQIMPQVFMGHWNEIVSILKRAKPK